MMKTELIFLGPPASGKGTQTSRLSKESSLPHVDTGSMLRAEVAAQSEEGLLAKSFMEKGQLVPAELVAKIIIKKLKSDECKNGFILDGFPRSIEQAEILDKALEEIDGNNEVKRLVINIDVNQELLLERIINRRSCKSCGKIFNLKTMPPIKEGICDACGGELVQRSDDKEETARSRFNTYNTETQPLIEFYTKKGWLVNVDGSRAVDTIYAEIKDIIG